MCMGGKKSAPPVVPPPAAPTKFEYVNADTSNSQQRQAAIASSTAAPTPSFGAELGASGMATPAGGMT